MRVNHGRIDTAMAEQFLDRANVLSSLQQMRREGMPQRMRTDRFNDARLRRTILDSPLD